MLTFKKLTLHNFGSYHHVEIDLQTRGFCLVTGQNNYIKDNALSNGSGKSFLWSALCFALTGETISGLKNNLKNILIDENKCYTEVEFIFDGDYYKIQRIVAPRSDMKIWKNDVDISGKGITESKNKLDGTLPILTKDLIASTILIGQGMPHKFSSFTPAGRKTLLEQLTNSDFMIADVKNKISTRLKFLTDYQTAQEKSLIANQVSLRNCEAQLSSARTELSKIVIPNFDVEIAALETELGQISIKRQELNTALDALEIEKEFKPNYYILTGGPANPVPNKTEAEAMYEYLIDKGIEVGNTFKLGTKYSESMGLYYANEENKLAPVVMGCYGIGIARILAAFVEQNNDEKGIIWPMSVAPYKVAIVVINTKDEAQLNAGNELYKKLNEMGIDALIDDRTERAGVKFNDMDLIGIPLRITIGKKIVDNIVELKIRNSDEVKECNVEDINKEWYIEFANDKLKPFLGMKKLEEY